MYEQVAHRCSVVEHDWVRGVQDTGDVDILPLVCAFYMIIILQYRKGQWTKTWFHRSQYTKAIGQRQTNTYADIIIRQKTQIRENNQQQKTPQYK